MGERPTFPTERDLWEAREEQLRLDLDVAYPGRIQSYDPVLQVADVVPLIRQQVVDDSTQLGYRFEELPIVPCVPVLWPRVGSWALTFALTPGDYVQLLVNTSAIGHWRVGNGDLTDPGDLRRQHLAHAVALPGLYPRRGALRNPARGTGDQGALQATDAAVVLGGDEDNGTRLTFLQNGMVKITQGATTVVQIDANGTVHVGGAAGEFVALANLVQAQLTALKSAIDGAAVAPSDGGALFKSNLMAALATWPESVAAVKAKAT